MNDQLPNPVDGVAGLDALMARAVMRADRSELSDLYEALNKHARMLEFTRRGQAGPEDSPGAALNDPAAEPSDNPESAPERMPASLIDCVADLEAFGLGAVSRSYLELIAASAASLEGMRHDDGGNVLVATERWDRLKSAFAAARQHSGQADVTTDETSRTYGRRSGRWTEEGMAQSKRHARRLLAGVETDDAVTE